MARIKSPSMPPTKYGLNKALVAVRNATDKTQAEFGRTVGINQSTIQRSEEGKRRLTTKEAEAIMAHTGADYSALIKGKVAKAIDGTDYTKDVFRRWRMRWVDPKAVDLAAHRMGRFVEELVRASLGEAIEKRDVRGTNPARYRHFVGRLGAFLTEIAEEYDLKKQANKTLMTRWKCEEILYMNVEELEEALGIQRDGGAVVGWNFKEADKHRSTGGRFKVTMTYQPMWNSMTGVKAIDGRQVVADVHLVDLLIAKAKLPWIKSSSEKPLIASVIRGFYADLEGNREATLVVPLGENFSKLSNPKGRGVKVAWKSKFLADPASRRRPTSSTPKAT